MTTPDPLISIAFPVLNEERRLERGVLTTLHFCRKLFPSFELLIADNGSTDRTESLGRELEKAHPEIRYVKVGRRGVGLALKAAWSQALGKYVGYMDIDLATDLSHLVQVKEIMDQSSPFVMISGSRLIPGARVVNRKILREITSRGFNLVLKTLLGVKFTDGMCGFKFLSKKAFDLLMNRGLKNDDWFFNTELLVKSEWNQIPIIEIPVLWTDDQDSRVKLFRTIRNYLKAISDLRTERDLLLKNAHLIR